jgi:phosphoglycolate phosphatase-like HAD superfamily hydrolase
LTIVFQRIAEKIYPPRDLSTSTIKHRKDINTMKLKGILFDMDGTIGDTVPLCIAAIQHTFQHYMGKLFTPPEVVGMFGFSEEGMFKNQLPDSWPEAVEMYLREYEQGHAAFPEPFNGIQPMLEELKARDLKLGIVTGKGPHSAHISAQTWNLDKYFSGIDTGSPDGPVKARGMQAFLDHWGLPASSVAYVGDAPSDIEASRQVGVIAVGAAWAKSTDAQALAATHPDELFTRVEDFAAWVKRSTEP